MPFNAQKMANIILNECESIEERCDGYKIKLVEGIVDILRAEKDNLVKGTYIQQKINDKCHEIGDFLARGKAERGELN